MPVRTVTTFIPPVAAKSHSELSGSLTPVHPHLPVHESPHLSQRLRSKLGPRRAAGPAKVTFPTSPPPSCQRSHCVKAQADKPPVRWTHEVNDNHIHPQPEQHLHPMHIPDGSPEQRGHPKGQLPWRPHHLPATLNRHPSPPNCFERTNFPVVKVLRGYPSGVNIPAETACS